MLEATSRSILISNMTRTFSKKEKNADFISTCQFAAKASEVDAGTSVFSSLCCLTASLHHSGSRSRVIFDSVFSDCCLGTGLAQNMETDFCITITNCITCSLLLNNSSKAWLLLNNNTSAVYRPNYPIIGA